MTPFSEDLEPLLCPCFNKKSLEQTRRPLHYFVFIRFQFLRSDISSAFFDAKSVVAARAFSNDSVFCVSVESDAFQMSQFTFSSHPTLNSVFKISLLSIVSNGKANSKNSDIPLSFHSKTE